MATVIVKNGSSTSNTAAVMIPTAATPGISKNQNGSTTIPPALRPRLAKRGTYTVAVSGVSANVTYIGLTPLSIGLYQADFAASKDQRESPLDHYDFGASIQ